MREIKFRGLCVRDNKQWVYGSCQKLDALKYPGIIEPKRGGKCYEVLPETVGQYTGLTDRNEVDMYDGDIVTCPGHPDNLTGRIYYNEVAGGFSILQDGICHYPDRFWKWSDLKVIGNIHQNPELLNK